MIISTLIMLFSNVLLSRFRFFNIPIKIMNIAVGTRISNEINTPLMVNAFKSSLAWGPFLRIWVDIDIIKPLMRGKMVHIEDV